MGAGVVVEADYESRLEAHSGFPFPIFCVVTHRNVSWFDPKDDWLTMPQAQIIELADQLVGNLNAQSFSLPFRAERGYVPTFDLSEMDVLKVIVVPKEDDGKLDTRESSQHEYAIDIGIQQKPAKIDNSDLDPLMFLTQEVADFFLFGKRPGGATLVSPSVRILYLQEHLQKLRQFTSVVTLTFRGWREAI